jgi:hypothetical protein
MGVVKEVKRVLIGVSSVFVTVGLLVMCSMLVWSFHLAKDFTGHYGTADFHRHFWNYFHIGAGLCLLGCFGLSAIVESRMAMRGGIVAFAAGFGLLVTLMPFVDFEGWTGAAAYTLTAVEFAGAAIVFVPAVIKRVWQKFWTRASPQ